MSTIDRHFEFILKCLNKEWNWCYNLSRADNVKTFSNNKAAANPSMRWNNLNASLMAATVFSSMSNLGSLTFCHHCNEADHSSSECVLLSVDLYLDPPRPRYT